MQQIIILVFPIDFSTVKCACTTCPNTVLTSNYTAMSFHANLYTNCVKCDSFYTPILICLIRISNQKLQIQYNTICIHRYVCTAFVCMQHFPDPASGLVPTTCGKVQVQQLCTTSVSTKYSYLRNTRCSYYETPPPPKKNIVDPKLG